MGTRVGIIGGGKGLASVLLSLKPYAELELSAIVTMMDSGGDTGRYVQAYGGYPLGDVRDALLALAMDNGWLWQLCATRFKESDPAAPLAERQLGNLLLLGLTELCAATQARERQCAVKQAIAILGQLLKVRGRVLGVTWGQTDLHATLADGSNLTGEAAIAAAELKFAPIQQLQLDPKRPVRASPDVLQAIAESDVIVLAPGSLYTSTLANVVVPGIREALQQTTAPLIYVLNLLPTDGQARGYTAAHHVAEIHRYLDPLPLTVVLVDQGQISAGVVDVATLRGPEDQFKGDVVASPLASEQPETLHGEIHVYLGTRQVKWPRASQRHDPTKLGPALCQLFEQLASGSPAGTRLCP